MMGRIWQRIRRFWATIMGHRLRKAIEQNEHAAAELDAVVREVLQK